MREVRVRRRPTARRASAPALDTLALGAGSFVLLVLIVVAALAMTAGMVTTNYDLVYLSTAFLASAIPLLVGVARGDRFDIFEPINLVAFAIFFGTTLRAPWLIWSDSTRADFLMMGTTLNEVSRNCPPMLLAIMSLTLGYAVINARVPLERFTWFAEYRFSRTRLWFAVWLFAALALLGLILFMQRYHITLSDNLLSQSMKRIGTFSTDEGEDVFGSGYERYLGSLSQHAFLLVCGLLVAGVLDIRKHFLTLAVLLLLSIMVPFLSSSRTTLVVMGINLCIFSYYYKRLQVSHLLYAGAFAIVLIAGMGALREKNQLGERAAGRDLAGWVVGSGNSLDLVRTSAIIDRVPAIVPHQYGMSYAALASAYVPRSIWPDKPQVALGPYVKGEIFQQRVRLNGWPTGMIAEGWLNFGFIGLIIPMFIFGALLKLFYRTFSPFLGTSIPATLLYSMSIWKIGFDAMGLNFAHGMTQWINYFVPMIVLLALARAPSSLTYTPSYPRLRAQ